MQDQHGILAVFFRCPVQEHPCIFAGFFRYSLTWILEKSWYVPVFFCWLLVKKLISQKTLLCVVICVNENWVALLFQDSLVLCSVKCKGWPFGTILVWRSRSWVRARAPCEGVVSTLFGRGARTWSDQTTQRKACGAFSANTNNKRQKTRLLAFVPPHNLQCIRPPAHPKCAQAVRWRFGGLDLQEGQDVIAVDLEGTQKGSVLGLRSRCHHHHSTNDESNSCTGCGSLEQMLPIQSTFLQFAHCLWHRIFTCFYTFSFLRNHNESRSLLLHNA